MLEKDSESYFKLKFSIISSWISFKYKRILRLLFWDGIFLDSLRVVVINLFSWWAMWAVLDLFMGQIQRGPSSCGGRGAAQPWSSLVVKRAWAWPGPSLMWGEVYSTAPVHPCKGKEAWPSSTGGRGHGVTPSWLGRGPGALPSPLGRVGGTGRGLAQPQTAV